MTIWKKRFAVPAEHGTWAWWTVPFAIGLAAGGHPTWTILPLLVATVAAFFAHQPAQIAVKALSGRRPRSDLAPALTWLAIYAVPIALGSACLVATGYARVLGLALPGVLVFGWHLWLVAKKAERRQMAIEMLAAGVLALTAPAAYWVAGGDDYPEPWFLWAMTWIQAAASIANVYLPPRAEALAPRAASPRLGADPRRPVDAAPPHRGARPRHPARGHRPRPGRGRRGLRDSPRRRAQHGEPPHDRCATCAHWDPSARRRDRFCDRDEPRLPPLTPLILVDG